MPSDRWWSRRSKSFKVRRISLAENPPPRFLGEVNQLLQPPIQGLDCSVKPSCRATEDVNSSAPRVEAPPSPPPPWSRLCRRNARGFETAIADLRGARFSDAKPALGNAYSFPSASRGCSDRPGIFPSSALGRHIPRPPVGREDHDTANAFWWLMAQRRSHTCAMRELSPGQPCGAAFRARRRNQAASAFDIRVHRERDREEMQQQQLNPTPTFARAFNAQALIENLTTYTDTC